MPMVTPIRLLISGSGAAIRPHCMSVLLMIPVRCSSTIQA